MKLWESASIGTVTLRNRTVRSATNEHLAERDGRMTKALIECYEELASHEVGLIITGHYAVDALARVDAGQPYLDERTDRALLQEAAERVHAKGGKLVIQLNHGGLNASEKVNGCPAQGPMELSEADRSLLLQKYAAAARLAKEAGFDGVQVHMAHGYLLSSYLNPKENVRDDAYGGSVENRFRFPGEVLKAVRKEWGPEGMVLVKVNCDAVEDLHRVLELCEEAGVDAAEVSGLGFAHQEVKGEPFYLKEALAAGEGIRIPLILVGGIVSEKGAEQVLEAGIPFVSFSRSLICEPDFIEKLKGGAEKSKCIHCNNCFRVYRERYRRCVLHRQEIPQLRKTFGE